MVGLYERLGASLRRAPYVWLVATILLYLVMISPLSSIAKDTSHASTGIAILGTAFIAYAPIGWFLMSRFVVPRAPASMAPSRLALLRWAFSTMPFLVGYAAVAAGGQQWVLSLGIVVSVILHVLAARALRRAEPSEA